MRAERHRLVKMYGEDSIAYSTLQADMYYFERSYGYIAYRKALGVDITLGPPVCAPEDRQKLMEAFLSHSKKPVFSYISNDTLSLMKDSGLYCAAMGIDRHVDITQLLRQPNKIVAGAIKKSNKANFQLQDLDFSNCSPGKIERLNTISKNYFKNAQCQFELSFINRPMQYDNDGMSRTLALCKYDKEHNGMFGYAVLNPNFVQGQVKGYLLDIIRFEPTRLWGVWLSTVWHIANMLGREGYALNLGFCPLYDLQNPPFGSTAWLNWQTRCASRLLRHSYYVQRLFELKSQIPGWQEPRFFASHSSNLVKNLLAFLNASGMRTRQLFGPELVRSIVAGVNLKVRRI